MHDQEKPNNENTGQPEKVNDGIEKGDIKEIRKKTDSYARYMGAGIQLVAPIIIGVFLGRWLDDRYDMEKATWIIVCPAVMIVVALYQFVRQFLKP